MKIVYLNHNVAWTGGTFIRAFACGTQLAARGHDVTLLTIAPRARMGTTVTEHQGVKVIATPDLLWGRGRSGWDPWDVLNRLMTLRQAREWDIVHSWDCRPAAILPALWARRRSRAHGAKLLTDWADWWGHGGTQGERGGGWMRAIWPLETFFEEHYRSAADATTTISTPLRDRAIALGLPAASVRILRQGCGAVEIHDRGAARARLGIAADDELIVYVGRLIRSDAALLFTAVSTLLSRRKRCRFVMVGNHGVTIPPALAAHSRFRATGIVDQAQLTDYTAACDLSLVTLADTLASRARWPSKANGFLSAGRAIVITDVGDLPALLAESGAAVVTAPDADAVVAGATRVLDDAALRTHLESAAADLAAGPLSWSRIAADLDVFYRSL